MISTFMSASSIATPQRESPIPANDDSAPTRDVTGRYLAKISGIPRSEAAPGVHPPGVHPAKARRLPPPWSVEVTQRHFSHRDA